MTVQFDTASAADTSSLVQNSASKPWLRRIDWALVVILLIAFLARGWNPGAYPVVWDETQIHYKALMLARHGQWTWLGNPSSWRGLPAHSPFSTYVLAIPYLLSTNPLVTRLFVALLGTLAVGILYVMMKRYYGYVAAIMTGLLFAVMATAVHWSRFVWNPNVAQPFIALWVFTGLLGYYEKKHWAQVMHWLMLSAAMQCQASYVLLAPVSLVLLIYGWFWDKKQRRVLLRTTVLAGVLVGVSLIPWIIGLASTPFFQTNMLSSGQLAGGMPPLSDVSRIYSSVVSSTEYWSIQRFQAPAGNWWPNADLSDSVLWLQTDLMLVTAVALIVLGVRDSKRHFPGLFMALAALSMLIAFPLASAAKAVVDFYLMPTLFGAIPVLGILLAYLWKKARWTRALAVVLLSALVIIQSWLVIATLRWLDISGTTEVYRAPLTVHQTLLRDWLRDGGQVVILSETVEAKYGTTEQETLWAVLDDGQPVRVIDMPQGIPVAPGGEMLVSSYKGTTIPTLFGDQTAENNTLSDQTPMFRWLKVTPDMLPKPTILPQGSARFSNGATLLGFQAADAPQSGKTWALNLLWTTERGPVDQQNQFSIRLIDDQGTKYAQTDVPSMSGGLWRPGDTVLNRIDLPIGDTLPADKPLSLQVVMYSLPDVRNADILDEAGNPMGQWALFPITGLATH